MIRAHQQSENLMRCLAVLHRPLHVTSSAQLPHLRGLCAATAARPFA
jgi:hypothetical protein